jgi:hypothetical protein
LRSRAAKAVPTDSPCVISVRFVMVGLVLLVDGSGCDVRAFGGVYGCDVSVGICGVLLGVWLGVVVMGM